MFLLFGFKTTNVREVPEVVYCGNDGAELAAAARKREKEFLRFGRLVHPTLLPYRIAHLPALEQEHSERTANSEVQRALTEAAEKERLEAEEAERLAGELKTQESKLRAAVQRAEADLAEAQKELGTAEKANEKKKASAAVEKAKAVLTVAEAALADFLAANETK